MAKIRQLRAREIDLSLEPCSRANSVEVMPASINVMSADPMVLMDTQEKVDELTNETRSIASLKGCIPKHSQYFKHYNSKNNSSTKKKFCTS
jgi:hypothetical protein